MSWAWYEFEQLWYREKEIENLRYEKEEKKFAEVSQDPNDSESHAGEVAESIANENSARIPVENKQRNGARNIRHEKKHRKQMVITERTFKTIRIIIFLNLKKNITFFYHHIRLGFQLKY